MAEPLYLLGSVLLVVTALLALACVVSQALLARWWETPAGRHVMAFQSEVAALAALWAMRVWFPDNDAIRALRSIAFVFLPVVLGWRLLIILKTWRAKRREHRETQ